MPYRPLRPLAIALALVTCLPGLLATTAPGTFQTDAAAACTAPPCLKWSVTYQGPQGIARAHEVALSPDGRTAYVVGAYYTDSTSTDLVVMAISVPTGAVLWSNRYDGPASADEGDVQNEDARFIAVSPDGGRVVVAATSQGTFGAKEDIATIAYNATTGDQLWVSRFNGPASQDDRAAGVVVDRSGRTVVAAGNSWDAQGFGSWAVLGYDLANGTALWSSTFTNPCNQQLLFGVAATAASPDVILGGMTSHCVALPTPGAPTYKADAFQLVTAAIAPRDGALRWWTAQGDANSPAASVALHGTLDVAGGRAFVSGGLTHVKNPGLLGGDMDVFLLATDLAGTTLWTQRYDSGGADYAVGSAAAPDGSRLFVVASAPGLGVAGLKDQNPDVLALAFEGTTGAQAWSRRFDTTSSPILAGALARDGVGVDYASHVRPALLDHASKLAFGFTSQRQPALGQVGTWGPAVHHVVLLSTASGALASSQDETDWGDVFASQPSGAGFVAVGHRGTNASPTALVRRFSFDNTPPRLTLPTGLSQAATAASGATVTYVASAMDDYDGNVPVTCTPALGTSFSLATTTVRCQATDTSGNTGTASFTVAVTYQWSGFQGDVQDGALLRARYADVAFRLQGASALVTDARARLWVSPASGGPESAAVARSGLANDFHYDAATQEYRFRWDTASVPHGAYLVRIDLGDGTVNTAHVTVS